MVITRRAGALHRAIRNRLRHLMELEGWPPARATAVALPMPESEAVTMA
jgi:hypothetical protein